MEYFTQTRKKANMEITQITKYLGYFADVPALIAGYTKAENKTVFIASTMNDYIDIPNITEENEQRLALALAELIEAGIACGIDYKNGEE